jgi:hypothetical protein
MDSNLPEIVRGMDSFTIDKQNFLHLGSKSFLTQAIVNSDGTPGGLSDRTPVGFTPDDNNLWQITAMRDVAGGVTSVVAHAGHNLDDIASSDALPVYYGDVNSSSQLIVSSADPVSGGIMALPPFLITYGSGGYVGASGDGSVPANAPPGGITAGAAFVTAQKVVFGLPMRNQGGPAALLWSLDSLVQMTFDSGITTGFPFDFSTVSDDISVLSSQGIIEFDSLYYWMGVDRFMVYNGVVRELPNNLNIDFFFDNLNFQYRQKAFAFKVPRWGEIWFCAPLFGATECNWAVIYNTRLQTWYDTKLPDGGRSAGIFAKVYQRPFMCDVDPTGAGFYTLWQHETGLDKVNSTGAVPIRAYYQTQEFSPVTAQDKPGMDKAYHIEIVEPDFVQLGDMQLTVAARQNARTPPILTLITPWPATATSEDNQIVRMRVEGRLMAFIFESNTPGGDFYKGEVVAHLEEASGRITR